MTLLPDRVGRGAPKEAFNDWGADFDLLRVDEALDLADDIGTGRIIVRTTGNHRPHTRNQRPHGPESSPARVTNLGTAGIIVGTDGYVVGTRGKYQKRRNEGTDRGNDAGKGDDGLMGVGNGVYTAGNVVGEGVGDGSAPGRQAYGGANRCRGSQYENDLAPRIG